MLLFVMVLRNLPLPPHARGRRRQVRLRGDRLASTPAYAGLTGQRQWERSGGPLYPRIHGADFAASGVSVIIGPLPPHTRG